MRLKKILKGILNSARVRRLSLLTPLVLAGSITTLLAGDETPTRVVTTGPILVHEGEGILAGAFNAGTNPVNVTFEVLDGHDGRVLDATTLFVLASTGGYHVLSPNYFYLRQDSPVSGVDPIPGGFVVVRASLEATSDSPDHVSLSTCVAERCATTTQSQGYPAVVIR